jgi:hypothetical protein
MKTMQKNTPESVQAGERHDAKRAYTAPAVRVLGSLEHLTENGMGADGDLTSSQPT